MRSGTGSSLVGMRKWPDVEDYYKAGDRDALAKAA
jgi:hypothetical protein